jgi:hypothetical protein
MNEALAVGPVAASGATQLEPTVLELEDMLYDILASGADPSLEAGTLEAVQTFLHEHARSKRSHAEFMAFFDAHGLAITKEVTLQIALPPMELRNQMPLPSHEVAEVARAPEPTIEVVPLERSVTPARKPSLAWLYGLAALAAISGGAIYALSRADAAFERVHAEARANSERLAEVQAEAAGLRQSLQQNAEMVRRVDQKSELLLQSLVSPLDPNTR